MNRIALRSALSLLLVSGLLGGCSWFHQRSDYYNKAAEQRPLEVPPDLDTPVTSNELVVPPSGGAAGATAAPSAASVSTAPPSGVAASAGTDVGSGALRVPDSVDHTYQRVGLALERAQVGAISARDDAAHSYTVAVSGLTESAPEPQEHHWYSRILHPFGGGSAKSTPVSGTVTVRVSADGSTARVEVDGSAEAARRVLAVLRERLS